MIDMETKLDDMQERNQTALDMVRHDAISPPPVIETARGAQVTLFNYGLIVREERNYGMIKI